MLKWWRHRSRQATVALLSAPIHGYRYLVSPLLPQTCRFQPTCSCYALEALAAHGALKGTWLTLRRLTRCHPFAALGGTSGYDPVPDRIPKHSSPR